MTSLVVAVIGAIIADFLLHLYILPNISHSREISRTIDAIEIGAPMAALRICQNTLTFEKTAVEQSIKKLYDLCQIRKIPGRLDSNGMRDSLVAMDNHVRKGLSDLETKINNGTLIPGIGKYPSQMATNIALSNFSLDLLPLIDGLRDHGEFGIVYIIRRLGELTKTFCHWITDV